MFTEGLTRAVLEGLKTKTRRLIKVPDTWHGIHVCGVGPDTDKQSLLLYDADGALIEDPKTHLCGQIMPKYKVGEVVAVAQSYREIEKEIERDGLPLMLKDSILKTTGYRNKMFVKADLMPHQIQINGCHVERLQDISDEDCLREGVRKLESEGNPTMFTFDGWKFKNKVNRCADSPKEAFAALIKKMHGRKAWDDNPWIFAYDFTRIK